MGHDKPVVRKEVQAVGRGDRSRREQDPETGGEAVQAPSRVTSERGGEAVSDMYKEPAWAGA